MNKQNDIHQLTGNERKRELISFKISVFSADYEWQMLFLAFFHFYHAVSFTSLEYKLCDFLSELKSVLMLILKEV